MSVFPQFLQHIQEQGLYVYGYNYEEMYNIMVDSIINNTNSPNNFIYSYNQVNNLYEYLHELLFPIPDLIETETNDINPMINYEANHQVNYQVDDDDSDDPDDPDDPDDQNNTIYQDNIQDIIYGENDENIQTQNIQNQNQNINHNINAYGLANFIHQINNTNILPNYDYIIQLNNNIHPINLINPNEPA